MVLLRDDARCRIVTDGRITPRCDDPAPWVGFHRFGKCLKPSRSRKLQEVLNWYMSVILDILRSLLIFGFWHANCED